MKRSLVIEMTLLYGVLFISKKTALYFPELINSYLSDFLCMPIVLSIARYGVAYWINDASFQLNKWHIGSATLAFFIAFEAILPQLSKAYTADLFDGLMYLLGALFYFQFQTPFLSTHKSN